MHKLFFHNTLKFRLTRHLLLVIFTVFFFSLILYYGNEQHSEYGKSLQITILNSLFFLGYAYISLFWLIPAFLLKGRIFHFALVFLTMGIALSGMKFFISDELFYGSVSPENFEPASMGYLKFILVNTKDMTFLVALFCVTKFTKDFIYTSHQRQKLKVQNREARQRLLQSQLNPHFLYNTINNLYALALLEPAKTRAVTNRIQKVLRYIVEQSRFDFVNLKEEVTLVKNYVLLEKLRYGKRLKVKFLKEGDFEGWRLPPMVLFFLAENCIRHGSRPDSGAPWLTISVETSPEKIILSTVNSKPDVSERSYVTANGNGLKNLKSRLEILYPEDGYQLRTGEDETSFRTVLELKKENNDLGRETYR
jgi:two-component system, LytTR family, sensor kinase